MGNKFLSLIIIPHTKSKSRTLSFSKKTIRVALWGSIVGAAVILGLTGDYLRIQFSRQSYRRLLSENETQKETLKQYEGSIGTLQEKVKGFEGKITQLNEMLGLREPGKMTSLSNGDYPHDGQALSSPPPQLSPANIQKMEQKTVDIQKNLDTLTTFVENQAALLASTPSIMPVAGLISSPFGYRLDPFTRERAFHYGLDIVAAYGNPVLTTADGFVLKINNDKMFGISIVMSHGFGYTTLYGHLSRVSVRVGQKLKRGDIIGSVGSTGKAIGPHVHYEVLINDRPVNPYAYLLQE
jgi:murein DD-endopeptidase MepM/ murein hydrolase activator NlpD